MSDDLLTINEAARRLGISAVTLYDWLGRSDHGLLEIRGHNVTVLYYQGGSRGQGRIRIPAAEVERLLQCMRVVPGKAPKRRRTTESMRSFPGITVPLGRPTGT